VTVTVEYTGSGSGIESVTAGSVDIGDSSSHTNTLYIIASGSFMLILLYQL
jgi:ABC-type phosphate transport system substrate-binding protein